MRVTRRPVVHHAGDSIEKYFRDYTLRLNGLLLACDLAAILHENPPNFFPTGDTDDWPGYNRYETRYAGNVIPFTSLMSTELELSLVDDDWTSLRSSSIATRNKYVRTRASNCINNRAAITATCDAGSSRL